MKYLFCSFIFTQTIFAKINVNEIVKIEISNQDKKETNKQLRKRVRQLEKAVAQLQEEVFELKSKPIKQTKNWSCFIKTSFNGTHLGKGDSQTEAKAIAIQKCEKSGASFCSENKVKCEEVKN